jgi:hypothetical protein
MHVDNKTWAKNSEKLKYKNVQKKIKHNNQTNKQSLIHGSSMESPLCHTCAASR